MNMGKDENVKAVAYDSETARCNKAAAICHTIEIVVIALAYIMEFVKGARTLPYVIMTIVIGIVPPVIEWVLLCRKKDTAMLKHVVGYGFGIFYVFISLTTNNTLAFVYAIPMLIAISVFNDFKYSIPINIGVVIVNCIQAGLFLKNGVYTSENLAGLEIQVLVMIIVAAYSMYTSKILEINKKEKVTQIAAHGEQTANILDNTMNISKQISDGIETISGKIAELDKAVNSTRQAMQEVTVGSTDTAEAVQKQLEMTGNISDRVNDVKSGAGEIADNIMTAQSAVDEGNKNVSLLLDKVNMSVESGKTVTEELEELKNIMSNMNSVVDIITGITSQTSLLALNASIEAARAGEAGKGFAVVASEISKMAGETKDATVKITDMIGSVSEAINKVVGVTTEMIDEIDGQHDAAAKTEESFRSIKESSVGIADSSAALADVVDKLAQANSEIVDSISTISAISEEVSAHANDTFSISEQNSEIVDEVVNISEQLRSLTAKLNV